MTAQRVAWLQYSLAHPFSPCYSYAAAQFDTNNRSNADTQWNKITWSKYMIPHYPKELVGRPCDFLPVSIIHLLIGHLKSEQMDYGMAEEEEGGGGGGI